MARWHTGRTLLNFATAAAHEWGLDERHARTIAVWMDDFQHKPTQGGVVLADAQADSGPGPSTAPPAPSTERPPGVTNDAALALQDPHRPMTETDAALPAPATTGSTECDATSRSDAQGDRSADNGCGAGDNEGADPAPTGPHVEHTAHASLKPGPPPTVHTADTTQGAADDRGLDGAPFLRPLPGGALRVKGAPSIFALPPASNGTWHPLVHDLAPHVLGALHGLELLFKAKRHSTGVAPWAVNMSWHGTWNGGQWDKVIPRSLCRRRSTGGHRQ